MDGTNCSGNITPPTMSFFSEFTLQDIVDQELNFDHQLIEMIRGEAPNNSKLNHPHTFTPALADDDHSNNNNLCPFSLENQVLNDFNSPTMSSSYILNSLSGIDDDMLITREEDDGEMYVEGDGDGEHSSATKSEPNSKKTKVDRSRTLISERRRRGRMKEKLYALRALVPNITKMDKASIVGDAVLYVQDLQMQAKKLKSQIEGLESSLKLADHRSQPAPAADTPNINAPLNHFLPVSKMIMQMEVIRIEEREFYVKIVSNRGQGVATSLYKALESLTNFIIHSSNLSTTYERFVLTFTLNVEKCKEEINMANLKLWISGAFLNQGFEFPEFSQLL